jgi:hypothetical protein
MADFSDWENYLVDIKTTEKIQTTSSNEYEESFQLVNKNIDYLSIHYIDEDLPHTEIFRK